MSLVLMGLGWYSVVALFVSYFFMSIMFPTIFALGLQGLGDLTKQAASFLVMAILGGALAPMFMGWLADQYSMQLGFVLPLLCFGYIIYFAQKVRG